MNLPFDSIQALACAKDLHKSGRLFEAIEAYRRVLAGEPASIEAWYFRGLAETQLQAFNEAVGSFEQAVRLAPNEVELHTRLADAHRFGGNMQAALASYEAACRLSPDDASCLNNVAATLQALGRLDEAVRYYELAIEAAPTHFAYLCNLGLAYAAVERYTEALSMHRRAHVVEPNSPTPLYNQANVLLVQRHFDAAVELYRQVVALEPKHADAFYNLTVALLKLKRQAEALEAAEARFRLAPDRGNSAATLLDGLMSICEWSRIDDLTQRVLASVEGHAEDGYLEPIAPFTFLSLPIPTTPYLQRRCSEKWARKVVRTAEARGPARPSHSPKARPSKLRIGYLSDDFHIHPVAYAVVELFESHDRDRFEIFGYSYGVDDDSPIRKRIEKGLDHFRDLQAWTLPACTQAIIDDRIDILVDLQGYTGESRTEMIATKPAPIQVNYLGFPGTMAADFIDYILVDDYVVRPDDERHFAEKIIRLPGTYLVADSRHECSEHVPSRLQVGLPEESLVLASFNAPQKLTPMIFDAWMRILRHAPQAVLWLRDWGETTCRNLTREAELRGVDSSRIVFAPPVPMAEHAARHKLVDLFLDTYPYNAHATASLALRLGVPLFTLEGETFPSRVAAGLLRSIGFEELVAKDVHEYEAAILELILDRRRLAGVRARLVDRVVGHACFDGRDFARKIERAFEHMWLNTDRASKSHTESRGQ